MRRQVMTRFTRAFLSFSLVFATLQPTASASTSLNTLQNPLPQALVLNQTMTNGIPMISSPVGPGPDISSQAAVVVDMSTGTVVYAKNPEATHYPASITKIMTAMLALQLGHLNDLLVASQNAVNQPPDKLYQLPGEVEPLDHLLYGLLLDSANDAAVEIAENDAHSVQQFADLMNQEARQLGATHTHFVNPNGLPDPRHVTTAYDMSLIARAAMTYPAFRKIVATRTYDWKGAVWQSKLSNLNSMLYYYPGCIGIKTGFTDAAHETLVVAATRGHQTFLAVLMDAPTDLMIRHDASRILDFSFAHYTTQSFYQKGDVIGQMKDSSGHLVPVRAAENVLATTGIGQVLAPASKLVMRAVASVHSGQVVGALQLHDENGLALGQIDAVVNTSFSVTRKRSVAPDETWAIWIGTTSALLLLLVGVVFWRRWRKQLR